MVTASHRVLTSLALVATLAGCNAGGSSPSVTVTVTTTATAAAPVSPSVSGSASGSAVASPTPPPTNAPNSCPAQNVEAAPCHFLNYVAGFETRPLTAGEKALAASLSVTQRSAYQFFGCELVGDVTVECRYTVKGDDLYLIVQPEKMTAENAPAPGTAYRVINLSATPQQK
ncbi:MAG: hypothetical protein IPL94_08525 [Tetrasphaera sp.]|nr:hypothetical protein [Tetrasphaera sp.]